MNRRTIFTRLKGAGLLPLVALAAQAPALSRFAGTLTQLRSVPPTLYIPSVEATIEDEGPLLQLCVEDGTTWLQKGAGMWRLDLHPLPDAVVALTTKLAYSGGDSTSRFVGATGPYGRAAARVVWLHLEPFLEHATAVIPGGVAP